MVCKTSSSSFIKSQNGTSLIEVLIASSIMLIIILALTNLTFNQQKQVKFLEAKLETFDVKTLLTKHFSSATSGCIIANNSIGDLRLPESGTPPVSFTVQKIFDISNNEYLRTGQSVRDSVLLEVESMKIINFNGSGDSFTGDLEIKLKPQNSEVRFKAIKFQSMNFTTTTVGSQKQITNCTYSANSTGSGESATKIFIIPGTYTFTVPQGVTKITAAVWGGGGGGSGGDISNQYQNSPRKNTTGSAGSAGGYVQAEMLVSPGEVLTIKVGAGGAGTNGLQVGGTFGSPPPSLGGDGNQSSVKSNLSTIIAKGGKGGPSHTAQDRSGGSNGEIHCHNSDYNYYNVPTYQILGGDFEIINMSGLQNVTTRKGSNGILCQCGGTIDPIQGPLGYGGIGSGGASGGARRPQINFNRGQDGGVGQVHITW